MTNQYSPSEESSAPVLTVIQHEGNVSLDQFEQWLDGVQVRVVRADRGESLPGADETDGLLVLGGTMSAYDDAVAPWLPAVRALMADAVERDVPVLGICLGAQLLAVATGGRVEVDAPVGHENGVIQVRLRPDAARDPVLGGVVTALGRTVAAPSMHGDAVTALPDGGTWLASSAQYPFQAFRIGSALGLQFHPEAGADLLAEWAGSHEDLDADEIRADYASSADDLATLAREIAEGFAAQVRRADVRIG